MLHCGRSTLPGAAAAAGAAAAVDIRMRVATKVT